MYEPIIQVHLLDISENERLHIVKWIRKNLKLLPKEAIELSKEEIIYLRNYNLAIDLFETINSGKCKLLIEQIKEQPGYNCIPGDCY